MPDLLTRMKQAMDSPEPPGAANPYDPVLREFAKNLEAINEWVQVRIEVGDRPELRYLVTGPRFRLFETSMMQSFWISEDTLKIFGAEPRLLNSPEELETYLVAFLKFSEFRTTLEEYERRCKEPVYASLRRRGLFDLYRGDVLVVVSPDDQRRLAEAEAGATFELQVPLDNPAEYDETLQHRYLESGGFGIRLETEATRREGDIVHLRGAKRVRSPLWRLEMVGPAGIARRQRGSNR